MLRNILYSAKKGAIHGGATIGGAAASLFLPIMGYEIIMKSDMGGIIWGTFTLGFGAAGALVGGIIGAGQGLLNESTPDFISPIPTAKIIASGLMGAAYTSAFAYPLTGNNPTYLAIATPAILVGAAINATLTYKEAGNKQQSAAKNPMSFYNRSSAHVGFGLENKENNEVDAAPLRP